MQALTFWNVSWHKKKVEARRGSQPRRACRHPTTLVHALDIFVIIIIFKRLQGRASEAQPLFRSCRVGADGRLCLEMNQATRQGNLFWKFIAKIAMLVGKSDNLFLQRYHLIFSLTDWAALLPWPSKSNQTYASEQIYSIIKLLSFFYPTVVNWQLDQIPGGAALCFFFSSDPAVSSHLSDRKKKEVWLDGMVPTGTNFRFEIYSIFTKCVFPTIVLINCSNLHQCFRRQSHSKWSLLDIGSYKIPECFHIRCGNDNRDSRESIHLRHCIAFHFLCSHRDIDNDMIQQCQCS